MMGSRLARTGHGERLPRCARLSQGLFPQKTSFEKGAFAAWK